MATNYLDALSEELYVEIDSPSGISVPYVKQYLLNNIGALNNYLGTSYSGVTGTILPQISGDAQVIYKQIFQTHWYDRSVKTSLGAGAYDWSEISEGDSRIRRVSKNELAKSYIVLKKDSQEVLTQMINYWRSNKAIPQQVLASGNCWYL